MFSADTNACAASPAASWPRQARLLRATVSHRAEPRRLTFQRHDPGAPLLSLITTAIQPTSGPRIRSTGPTLTPDTALLVRLNRGRDPPERRPLTATPWQNQTGPVGVMP